MRTILIIAAVMIHRLLGNKGSTYTYKGVYSVKKSSNICIYTYKGCIYIYVSLFRVGFFRQTLHNSTIFHRLTGSKVSAKTNYYPTTKITSMHRLTNCNVGLGF